MTNASTPGPWHVSTTGMLTNAGQIAVMATDYRVCLVDAPDAETVKAKDRWRLESPTRSANAALIAAAPDLLEALRDLVAFTERQTATWPDQPQSLTRSRAALAKSLPSQTGDVS